MEGCPVGSPSSDKKPEGACPVPEKEQGGWGPYFHGQRINATSLERSGTTTDAKYDAATNDIAPDNREDPMQLIILSKKRVTSSIEKVWVSPCRCCCSFSNIAFRETLLLHIKWKETSVGSTLQNNNTITQSGYVYIVHTLSLAHTCCNFFSGLSALLYFSQRKGYDTRAEDVPAVLAIHNLVNEEGWSRVRAWESKYSASPKLKRFVGRPRDISPRAWIRSVLLGYEKLYHIQCAYVTNATNHGLPMWKFKCPSEWDRVMCTE